MCALRGGRGGGGSCVEFNREHACTSACASRYAQPLLGLLLCTMCGSEAAPFAPRSSPRSHTQGTTRELLESAALHARPMAPAHPFVVEELDSEGEVAHPAPRFPGVDGCQVPRDSMDGFHAPPCFGGFAPRWGRSLELGAPCDRDSVDLHVPRSTAGDLGALRGTPHRPLKSADRDATAEGLESPPMGGEGVEEPRPPLTPVQLPDTGRTQATQERGSCRSWKAHDPSSLLTPYGSGLGEEGADEDEEASDSEPRPEAQGRPRSAVSPWLHSRLPPHAVLRGKRGEEGDWRRQSFGRRDVLGSLGPWEEGEKPVQGGRGGAHAGGRWGGWVSTESSTEWQAVACWSSPALVGERTVSGRLSVLWGV